ncbi:hypothetical protein [Streptomyces salinarius]|uniref:hypothetical protein n=1 Tax=Streptomyces salinarius TaxID=2762598 RepID=UPI002852B582|nr:hypothetical protein [Streptomyces salinarius]
MSEDLVKAHVRKWLAANVTVQETFRERVREVESSGLRIVDGGQTGSYDDDGRADWEVTDWRTGEVVASGHSTFDGMDEALRRVDPDRRFTFLDRLSEATELPEVEPTAGLPESLCDALVEWLEEKADAEEVAEWLGEPVGVIEQQMRNEVAAALTDLEPTIEH